MKHIHLTCLLSLAAMAMLAGGCGTGSILTDTKVMEAQAKDYWVPYNVPPLGKGHNKLVAIAELDVEFITEQLELSADGKGPTFVAKTTNYGKGLQMELPGMIYHMLSEESDLNLVPMDRVNEAKAYAKLTGTRMGAPTQPYRLFIVSSDCGRPKEACIYPAYGLKAIDSRQKDVEAVLTELLRETNADAVLRIRLRVGVYQGRAAVQCGSVIDLTGKKQIGSIESIRSLVGDELVVDGTPEQVAGMTIYRVNAAKFRESIRKLVVPYLKMAIMSTR